MSGTFTPDRKSKTDPEDANFWATRPETMVDARRLYGRPFVLDVCAEPLTAKCDNYYCLAEGSDALLLPWPSDWWCNPPFDIKQDFIRRARYMQSMGFPGMMLLPYEPCSGWWKELLEEDAIIYEPDGRIGFMERDGVTRKSGVNFPSALVCFPAQKIGKSIRVSYVRTKAPRKPRATSFKRKPTRKTKPA